MSYNSKYTGVEVENLLGKAGTALQEHQDISNLATKTELNKKQDTISDLATIRANAEKGATALQSVPSEYVTETELSGKGYATTSALSSGLSGKVDKDGSKVLSTNDFTNALKSKLEGLSNYDDTTISNAVNKLRTDFDTLVSGDTTSAIKTFNEVIAFLDGINDTQDLESIVASIEQQIAGKQAIISDLETIRIGASKGATAVQPSSLHAVATSGSYNDLTDKPTIPNEVTESTVSGWGFTKNAGTYSKPSTGIPKTDLASDVQTLLGKADTALQTHQDVSGKLDRTEAARTYIPFSGGSLTNGATLTLSQYGSRTVTISGNNIIADMSRDEGTWAGNFASVKDPVGDEITMLGWYGSTNGLIHIFMGGSYLNPAMKMTKNGAFTFMYNPKVGDKTIATNEDVASIYATKTDVSGKLDSSTAVLTYLSKTDASNSYLGKTANAVSATKATQDASGNVITSTYATKSEMQNEITLHKEDTEDKITEITSVANEANSISKEAERVAYNAVNTATLSDSKAESAKNAVATLQGLGNTTTAQQTLAGQVLQIETNKQNLLLVPSFALIKETNYNL